MDLFQWLTGHDENDKQRFTSYLPNKNKQPLSSFYILIIIRLSAAALLLFSSLFMEGLSDFLKLIFALFAAIIAGYDLVLRAAASLLHGRFFDERVLIILTVIVTFCLGKSNEGAVILIIYRTATLCIGYLLEHIRKRLENYVSFDIEKATIIKDGAEKTIPVHTIKTGDILYIRSGEMVPLDCVLLEGRTSIDISMFTGEKEPKPVAEEEILPAGSLNLSSPVQAEVITTMDHCLSARVMDVLSSSVSTISRFETRIRKTFRFVTPAMLLIGICLGVLQISALHTPIQDVLYQTLMFVVTGTYTMMISFIPLVYLSGICGGAKQGILFRDKSVLDSLTKTKAVIFDKNGTLTTGNYRVLAVKSDRLEAEFLLRVAAHAEALSAHPIAQAIVAAYDGEIYIELIERFQEHSGIGISVSVDQSEIHIGSRAFLESMQITVTDAPSAFTTVYMAINHVYVGRILLSDTLKEGAAFTVESLSELCGKHNVSMVSGDNPGKTRKIAEQIGIYEYQGECNLQEKLHHIASVKEKIGADQVLALVTSRSSDALQGECDIHIHMGNIYERKFPEAPQILLLDDKPAKLMTAVSISENIRRIIMGNLCIAIGIKIFIFILNMAGIAPLWITVLSNFIIGGITVLYALRAFRTTI